MAKTILYLLDLGFPGGELVKNLPANAGDPPSISGSGRSPGGGPGDPLQDSCLENPVVRGAWRAKVHGVRHDWEHKQLLYLVTVPLNTNEELIL